MLKTPSSPSLQFLIPLAMSPYRGARNQWHGRGFSTRPYAPASDSNVGGNNDNTGEFRSHYNPPPPRFNFRPNSDPHFNRNQSFQPPPPYSNPYQQFAPPPHYNQSQDFRRHGQPRPRFNPNQQLRPPSLYSQGQYPNFDQRQQVRLQGQPSQPFGQFRPQQPSRPRPSKPLDYRNWEFAKPGPPPECERFTVLSYNILADYLAINHQSKLYFHIPRHILDWEFRKKNIMFELGLWSADILCFQEVDRFQDFEEDLKIRGYSGVWKMRSGEAVDGCAIFWRSSRFKLLHVEDIQFNKLGLRDNVAQICVLESLNVKSSTGLPLPASPEVRHKVVICNIHVLYNPKRGDIKLGQVRVLLDRAYATSKLWDDAPVVLCGDFNSTPKSSLYNFIAEQKLNVCELPRDKISGQYYAETRFKRSFTFTARAQPTDNATQSSIRVDNKEAQQEEGGIKGTTITSSMSSQPESITVKPDFSGNLLTNTTLEDKKIAAQPEAEEESEGYVEDVTSEGLENFLPDAISNDNSLSTEELGSHVTNDASMLEDGTIVTTSPDELPEAIGDVSIGEDSTSSLTESHGHDEADFVDGNETLDTEISLGTSDGVNGSLSTDSEAYVEKPAYDPSAWTPMEIETATGSSECTTMEHSLKLRSTYTEVEDYSGTRDSNGEPQVTSYHTCFQGTLDYIWRSEGLQTVRVLAPIPKHAMQWTPGYPTRRWGSDHIALVSELAFTKDVDDKKSEVQ